MSPNVWYVAYGSNVHAERFSLYLRTSRDTSQPSDSRPLSVPHPVVFAGASKRWNQRGVAFLDLDTERQPPAAPSLCRAWRIGHDQFEDLFRQENGQANVVPIDLDSVSEQSGTQLLSSWYGRLHRFTDIDGEPAVTFTSATRISPLNAADPSYLRVIAAGLAECWGLNLADAAAYLHRCPGIADGFTIEELGEAISGPVQL